MDTSLIVINVNPEDFYQRISQIVEERFTSNLNKPPLHQKSELFGTRKEVSKELRISLPTLNDLTKRGRLKSYRIGGRVLYKWEEVLGCLEEINSVKYKRI